MTFFHFGNCAALACVPYFIVYKFSGLSEYGSFWKCVQAGMIYLFTQLCKMMILATFFPTFDQVGSSLDFVSEFMKSTIDLADLLGLYFVMTRVAGKGEIKFLVAGLGWATAELLMTRFLPLWVGARGVEFDWKYIQMSFDSNIFLIQHISTATLVWLWGRNDLHKSVFPIVLVLLIFNSYKPLIVEIAATTLLISSWSLLLIKFSVTILIATIALQIYLGLAQTISSY